jgi:thiol:disulfide interchange protein DsbD
LLTRLPDGSGWRLTVPRAKQDALGEAIPQLPHLSGILRAASGWSEGDPANGLLLTETPIEAAAAATNPATTAPAPAEPKKPVLLVFLLMFVGGVILNLMPCVFPVIGLKIMGFVQQASHDRAKIVKHGLVFTAGVLVSFWILAGLLLAGGIRNWGSQLENSWVVFSLILVMLALAMSMYGVFEIGTSATGVGGKLMHKQGLAGSFFSGVLATVVATPCSAPILGIGLSAAVQLPSVPFMIAFTLMALGLSLPYLILSLRPHLIAKLPRPGPWMESFKQGMSFLLFGTVGYLLWLYAGQVFEQHAGQKGLWVVLGLSTIAAALWVYGRWSLPHRTVRVRWIGRAVAAALLLVGILAAKPDPAPAPDAAERAVAELEWQPWSAELQTKLLAEGRPVYVDFTARWCFTCQTNKAAAYTAEVRKIFHQHKVATLRADKTSANPAVDAEMRRLGKAAIPVNVLHLPGDPAPRFTNTVLTAGYLAEFLRQHLP